MSRVEEALRDVAGEIDIALDHLLPRLEGPETQLLEAMRYASLGAGKRFRPLLVRASAELFHVAASSAVRVGAAVEMVHAYSLVHDDLPAMDNADLRRGKPSCHIAFDEATAILAGDALLTFAFELLARPATHADPAVRAELCLALAQASGPAGMVGGQVLDIASEKGEQALHSLAGVTRIQQLKTGALIRFSTEAGAILAGLAAADPRRVALRRYGEAIGAAFQIADDLLDAEGEAGAVGKAVGKDAAAGKATFVTVLGIEGARSRLHELNATAHAALAPFGAAAAVNLAGAIEFVSRRRG